jgi:hypothetical protein
LVGGASTQALGRNFHPKLSVSRSFYKNLHHFGMLTLKRKKKLLKSRRFLNLNALEKFRVLVTSDTMAEEDEQILKSLHHPGNTLIHTRQLGSYLIKLAPIFAAVIEEGCDQGLFKSEHPRECAEFMLAGFQFLTDLGFYPWSQAQLARRMKAFPSLIEAQLSAPKGSFSFLTE